MNVFRILAENYACKFQQGMLELYDDNHLESTFLTVFLAFVLYPFFQYISKITELF